MVNDVRDRVALVSGSTRGVGEAVARRLAAAGMSVVITGRSEQAGREVERSIRDSGGRALFVSMDISVEQQVADTVRRAVDEFGALHVLVNNAAPTDHIIARVDKRVTE